MIKCLLWALKKLGWKLPVPTPPWHIIPREVRDITDKLLPEIVSIDTAPQSGEWKRHQVYAKGLKMFPYLPKHYVGYGIEVAFEQFVEQ